jgi:hypothetical protein
MGRGGEYKVAFHMHARFTCGWHKFTSCAISARLAQQFSRRKFVLSTNGNHLDNEENLLSAWLTRNSRPILCVSYVHLHLHGFTGVALVES